MRTILLIFLFLVFISGIYFCLTFELIKLETMQTQDGLSGPTTIECPDMLIKSGNSLLLYNSKMPEEAGVNPMPFYSLDEYINYLEIQKKKGIHCPVLFVQEENNTQGKPVFRIRPDVFDPQAGLPTSTSSPLPYSTSSPLTSYPQIPSSEIPNITTSYRSPMATIIPNSTIDKINAADNSINWNKNNYTGFDPENQDIGVYTTLDAIHDSTYVGKTLSDNPMDENWGGVLYTKSAVDSGKYKENEVVPPSANSAFVEKSDNIHSEKKADQMSIFS